MFDLIAVQQNLRDFGFDGWLFYDFRGSNILTRRVLELDPKGLSSRRFFYFVPALGEPKKLVHRIEPARSTICPAKNWFTFAGRNLRRVWPGF